MVQKGASVWLFFALQFAFTWSIFLFAFLASGLHLLPPFPQTPTIFIAYLATYGPTIVAFILTYRHEGKSGVKHLISRVVGREALPKKKVWYLPTFLLWPIISGLTLLFTIPFRNDTIHTPLLFQPTLIPLVFLVSLISGPMAEEFGWRGYALDRLQEKWNALYSSLILGTIWAVFHFPAYFVPGTTQYQNLQQYGFIEFFFLFFGVIGVNILFNWLYAHAHPWPGGAGGCLS